MPCPGGRALGRGGGTHLPHSPGPQSPRWDPQSWASEAVTWGCLQNPRKATEHLPPFQRRGSRGSHSAAGKRVSQHLGPRLGPQGVQALGYVTTAPGFYNSWGRGPTDPVESGFGGNRVTPSSQSASPACDHVAPVPGLSRQHSRLLSHLCSALREQGHRRRSVLSQQVCAGRCPACICEAAGPSYRYWREPLIHQTQRVCLPTSEASASCALALPPGPLIGTRAPGPLPWEAPIAPLPGLCLSEGGHPPAPPPPFHMTRLRWLPRTLSRPPAQLLGAAEPLERSKGPA